MGSAGRDWSWKEEEGMANVRFWEIVHRINTYPLVHLGWLHLFLNLIAWVPLAVRFEREVGSAKMGALVLGREFSSGEFQSSWK